MVIKRALPISLRFFALAFLPVGLALTAGFYLFGKRIEENVKDGLGQTMADAQRVQTRLRLESRLQREVLVGALAESATLKAGLTLWRDARGNPGVQRTIEDQLMTIGEDLDADLLGIADADERPVAALSRNGKDLAAIGAKELPAVNRRMAALRGELFEVLSVPVNTDSENLGVLIVGRRFDVGSFHSQAVLLNRGRFVQKAGVEVEAAELEQAFGACGADARECSLTFNGSGYLALAVGSELLDEGYVIWTLHSVEAASAELLGTARRALFASLIAMLGAALLADVFGARAVAGPLVALIYKLREGERCGVLHADFPEQSTTQEVNELARAFNRAARAVAESKLRLDETYLEITQSMAQTLDARDQYTSGHSSRVSKYAVAIAKTMNLTPGEIEIIRVGANFHDIGKIGIPDAVLQKPGKLTPEEFEIIKLHPTIGKRILEGVAMFRDYLPIVELHHENHDGTGYPLGLRGEDIPLGARIVHVVDAFDAMTTNRPYRDAMPREKAVSIIRQSAGSQFDPTVVQVFLALVNGDAFAPPSPQTLPDDVSQQLSTLQKGLETLHETSPVV